MKPVYIFILKINMNHPPEEIRNIIKNTYIQISLKKCRMNLAQRYLALVVPCALNAWKKTKNFRLGL